MAEDRANPVAKIEGKHGFQDLSSLARLMNEVPRRTEAMEGRFA